MRLRASLFKILALGLILMPVGSADLPAFFSPQGGAPEVEKVEPPGWWAGHSINPVSVMIRGRNLFGGRVESSTTSLKPSDAHANPAGTYLFVNVWIEPQAKPGQYSLKINTDQGTAHARFDVLVPLARQGRFAGFSPDAIIYLIMPDRFSDGDVSNDNPPQSPRLTDRRKSGYFHGGDFQGIINHLPYLKDLGVTAIWLTPIYKNANHVHRGGPKGDQVFTDFHGYSAVDFYGVDEHFGDLIKLRELVDAAHRLGIKVIQDEVANHTGPDHPWVKDPPTPTWFNGSLEQHISENWQVWTLMDPHATPGIRKPTLDGWFANLLPDLNQNDTEVERYLIQNTLWWIGSAGFDGIREDTMPYVPRRFLSDWMGAIKREYPQVTVVGEVFDEDPALVSFFQGGAKRFDGIDTKVDTLFDFPLFFAIRQAFAQQKPLRNLAITLGHDYLYPNPELLVTFLGLHDVPRFVTEAKDGVAGLELADTFLMTARGIPMIYYGDEIAMPGGDDPENRRDFPGGWPGDARDAFEGSGRTPDEEAVFGHLRKLTHLRSELEPLRRGSMIDLAVSEQSYAYARVKDRAAVVVVLHNTAQEETIEFDVAPLNLSNGIVLQDRLGMSPDVRVEDGRIRVRMPPRAGSIFTAK